MKVTLKLYATLSDYLPAEARKNNTLELDLEVGATVSQVIASQSLPLKLCHLVLIDGVYLPPEARATRRLAEGETVAIWPPIAGG